MKEKSGGRKSGKRRIKNLQGASTLEVLLAFSIFILILTALVLVSYGSQDAIGKAEISLNLRSYAIQALQESILQGFDSVEEEKKEENTYTKELTVEVLTSFAKEIQSEVISSINAKKSIFSEIIINPDVIFPSDTCNVFLNSNWESPSQTHALTFPAFDTLTKIDVLNKKIYAATNSNTVSDPDFHIVDIADLDNPIIRSIHTGPGLNDLFMYGRYVYAANSSINAQLQVIDISDVSNPVLLSSFKLPTVVAGVGNAVFYHDKKAYVGTTKTDGPEFNVIDVADPLNPLWLGGFETNTVVNDVAVVGEKAYLATATGKQVWILDVSNPAFISEIGSISLPQWLSQSGKSLEVLGDTMYLGRTYGGGSGTRPELQIFDENNLGSSLDTQEVGASINDIFIRSGLAFTATNDPLKEFQIWNVQNSSSITQGGFLNLDNSAVSLDCEEDILFVSTESSIKVIEGQ